MSSKRRTIETLGHGRLTELAVRELLEQIAAPRAIVLTDQPVKLGKKEVANFLNIKEECIKTLNSVWMRIELDSWITFEIINKIENLYRNCILRKIEKLEPSNRHRLDILIKNIDKFLIENQILTYKYEYYDNSIRFYHGTQISLEFLGKLKTFLDCNNFVMGGEGTALRISWS